MLKDDSKTTQRRLKDVLEMTSLQYSPRVRQTRSGDSGFGVRKCPSKEGNTEQKEEHLTQEILKMGISMKNSDNRVGFLRNI